MLLQELFSKEEKRADVGLVDDVIFFIDHDDDLHKEHFLPIVDKLKSIAKEDKDEVSEIAPYFTNMVDKGCEIYYNKFKVQGRMEDIFTKEFKNQIKEKLAKKHLPYIVDGHYDPKEA
jgi:hypothetical protein